MKKIMIDAFELKRQGYYKQAIELYYKLLSETDDNLEILTELADLYYLMNNNAKATHYIDKVLEIEPNHVQCLKILKKIYEEQQEFNSAIDTAKKICEINSNNESILELLELLYKQGDYDQICKYNIDDDNTNALLLKAKSYYKLLKYDEAKNILEKIDSNDEASILLLDKIYYKTGNIEKIKEVYKKLKEIDLKDSESLNLVGLNYIENLDFDKAIECFKKAIEIKDNEAKYYYNLGQAYFLKGWIDEAKNSFNKAICLNPLEENYHYSLAYLFYRIGDYDNALVHLEGDTDSEESLNSKILKLVIQAEKGDLAKPKIELEKMLKDNPNNESILYSLAKIYYKLDMFKQAKSIMQDVLKLNSKSFEYNEYYIRLLLKLNELEEAKTLIDELEKKYPKYYYAKVLEGEYYMLIDDNEDLYNVAQELIELDINHYEGYYFNATALFEQGDINFAIESLKKAITLDVNNADLYLKMAEFYQAMGRYEDAFEYIKEASDIDKSAKNRDLYMQLSAIVRRRNLTQDKV